jgi:hypothetical protein
MSEKRLRAKDIPDQLFINVVEQCQRMRVDQGLDFSYSTGNYDGSPWALIWDVAAALPSFPEKVVAAKFSALYRRGIIDGCPCGCRGDLQVIDPALWPERERKRINPTDPPAPLSSPLADARKRDRP